MAANAECANPVSEYELKALMSELAVPDYTVLYEKLHVKFGRKDGDWIEARSGQVPSLRWINVKTGNFRCEDSGDGAPALSIIVRLLRRGDDPHEKFASIGIGNWLKSKIAHAQKAKPK
jgi:hypothetical protein